MRKRVFISYQEYYLLTKPLKEFQKQILFNSLSPSERSFLEKACKTEGWEDLFIINKIDQFVDSAKEDFGQDLILLRMEVLSGKPKKISRQLWDSITSNLSSYPLRLTWHILEGITAADADQDSVILISSRLN